MREEDGRTRIAYLIGQLGRGGTERQLVELVRRLDRTRYHVAVCCVTQREDPWGPILRGEGFEVTLLGQRMFLDPRPVVRLGRFLRGFRPRLLHSFLYSANVRALLIGPVCGVPGVVISERTLPFLRGAPRAVLLRWLARRARAIVVNARCIGDWLARDYGVPADRIEVIPNGIDLELFRGVQGEGPRVRRALGVPETAPLGVIVANLAVQKDHRTFLRACELVLRERPDARFLVVGDGPLRAELEAEAARVGPRGSVLFLGPREDVPAILAASDVFVLTSAIEGCPNAVLEAMAARRPVVCTDAGGCREIVQPGVTGYVLPVADSQAVAARVLDLLSRPDRGRTMGEAGRRRVEEEFSVGAMVARTERLYDELLRGT